MIVPSGFTPTRLDLCCDEIHVQGTQNVTIDGIASGHIVAGGLFAAALTGSWRSLGEPLSAFLAGDGHSSDPVGTQLTLGTPLTPQQVPMGYRAVGDDGVVSFPAPNVADLPIMHRLGARWHTTLMLDNLQGAPSDDVLHFWWQVESAHAYGRGRATFAGTPNGRTTLHFDSLYPAATEPGDVLSLWVEADQIDVDGIVITQTGTLYQIEPWDTPTTMIELVLYDKDQVQQRVIASHTALGWSGTISLPSISFMASDGDYVGARATAVHGVGIDVTDLVLTGTRLGPKDPWESCDPGVET